MIQLKRILPRKSERLIPLQAETHCFARLFRDRWPAPSRNISNYQNDIVPRDFIFMHGARMIPFVYSCDRQTHAQRNVFAFSHAALIQERLDDC